MTKGRSIQTTRKISQLKQEIKRTYAEFKRQLEQSFPSQNPPTELDQEAGKTASSERCNQERYAEAKSEDLKEIPMPKEPLNKQNSDVQKLAVVSSNNLITALQMLSERWPDCLRLHSLELFIPLLQLHCYFLLIQCHLCLL